MRHLLLPALLVLVVPTALLTFPPPAHAASTTAPASVDALLDLLSPLWTQRASIQSATVSAADGGVLVKIKWRKGATGAASIFTPIRNAKIADATAILEKIASTGTAPTRDDAQSLFDMIDPQSR